ncbi:MAG: YbaK/EbsC family protein [Bryobacteraceae bacterium]
MISRWSELHIPTLRDDPSGIPTAGERLLRRAGFLRDAGWLPLAVRSMRRIEASILRDGAIRAHEVSTAADPENLLWGDLRSYKQLPRLLFSSNGGVLHAAEVTLGTSGLSIPAVAGNAGCTIVEAGPHEILEAGAYRAAAEDAVSIAAPPAVPDPADDRTPELVSTPGMKTIADVAAFLAVPETSLIKTLVMMAGGAPVLALVRGDDALSHRKLERLLAAEVRPAEASEIAKHFQATAGSLGPVGIKGINIVSDLALEGRRNMIAGANQDDFHLRGVTPGRHFSCEFHDLRQARAGEFTSAGDPLEAKRGFVTAELSIAPAKRLRVLDDRGKEAVPTVTRLTIWTDRILRAAAELGNDKDGLILTAPVAPFDVVVTPVNVTDPALAHAAGSIAQNCSDAGLAVLLDDRDERPGVKFKDADLIGVPVRINIGKKVSEGKVEVVNRRTREMTGAPRVEAAEIAARIVNA